MAHPNLNIAPYIERSLQPFRGRVNTIDVMMALQDYLAALVEEEFPPEEHVAVRHFLFRHFCCVMGLLVVDPWGADPSHN
jgi:hypothetical protein